MYIISRTEHRTQIGNTIHDANTVRGGGEWSVERREPGTHTAPSLSQHHALILILLSFPYLLIMNLSRGSRSY